MYIQILMVLLGVIVGILLTLYGVIPKNIRKLALGARRKAPILFRVSDLNNIIVETGKIDKDYLKTKAGYFKLTRGARYTFNGAPAFFGYSGFGAAVDFRVAKAAEVTANKVINEGLVEEVNKSNPGPTVEAELPEKGIVRLDDVERVLRYTYTPEMLRQHEIATFNRARAGASDWAKWIMLAAMFLIFAAIAFYIITIAAQNMPAVTPPKISLPGGGGIG